MTTLTETSQAQAEIKISAGVVDLEGELIVPARAAGIVIFAHGSGSSRHSRRNQLVARTLRWRGLGTLLFDLLTAEEEAAEKESGELRFNINLLAERLLAAAEYVSKELPEKKLGFFGASTGGGAALVAAAQSPVAAVVSRGGRPDLAAEALPRVTSPTLLLVGSADKVVIELNQQAYAQLTCEKEFKLVPNATHLFEEPGALEQVAENAAQWFMRHFRED